MSNKKHTTEEVIAALKQQGRDDTFVVGFLQRIIDLNIQNGISCQDSINGQFDPRK